MCKAFLDRIKGIYTKEDVITKLREEFKGNDDFSLGVQHAIMVMEKKKEET